MVLILSGYGNNAHQEPAMALLYFISELCKQIITGLISALANRETHFTLEQSEKQKLKQTLHSAGQRQKSTTAVQESDAGFLLSFKKISVKLWNLVL